MTQKPKLLLIQPGSDADRLGSRRRRKSSIPKLNLPLLAAYAGDRFEVSITDESVEDLDLQASADLIGITVLTQLSRRAYELADAFRRKGSRVVLGGFHVFFYPDEASEHADALVIGEADGVWEQLLEDFLQGTLQARYQGSAPHDLVGLPHPRLDLLNQKAYSFTNVIETARGCPNRCSYCAVTLYWGYRARYRPIGEVIDEIQRMPPGEIIFIDDNIVGSPDRAKELFRAMIPFRRRWSGQADMKIARDPELLELAARSGCNWLFIGIESLNTDNLREVSKAKVNVASQYVASIRAVQAAGIKVFGSFIFGLDHDDQSVFDHTIDFCEDNRLKGANFYIFTPLPFTVLFDKMHQEGRILHTDWSKYDMNHVVFLPKKMSPGELLEGYLRAYRRFYSVRSIARRMLPPFLHPLQVVALNAGRLMNYRHFEEACRR